MLMTHFVLTVVASTLAVRILPHPSVAQVPNCPDVCTGSKVDNPNGALPAGTQLIVVVGTPSNGAGTEGCNATCSPCKMGVAVSFYGNDTGNCVTLDHGGSGWIPPLVKYNRIGWLYTQCDGSADCLSVRIGDCASLPGGFVYSEDICLFCAC